MSQINLKQLLAGDAQQEYIDKLNFNFGQISQFGGGPPGITGGPGGIGLAGGRGPIGLPGLVGIRGSNWKVVEADPTILNTPNPLPDDLAYNRYTGHLFSFVGGVWVDEGKLVQDGTFFEKDGTVFYSLPLHEGIVKSIVLSPVDYRTLDINPLVGNFRPTLKMLSNNLSNPFLTFGFIDSIGLEVQRTKQVGMYLEDNSGLYDFILSNASGNNISSAGPNHFKIGVDNTYRFTASGDFERLQFDLSDVSDKYVLFGGDNDGFTKLIFGSDKQSPALAINDLGRVGINNLNPQTQLHVNGVVLKRPQDSVSTPLILGSDVGGGNDSKIHFEVNRLALLADGYETDSTLTSLRRVDNDKFSGFVGFTGGLTNVNPTVEIGFSAGPSAFSPGHNDYTVVSVNSNGVGVTGDLSASNSLTIGDRSKLIGKWSLSLGEGTEASEEGSVAIGSRAVSNHKNATVIGSGNSIQADSFLVVNHFSVKRGGGSFQPIDPKLPDYFNSRNPSVNDINLSTYKEITASLQHDDTINGMEIVNFGDTHYSNDPLLLFGQPRQYSSGMSLMITGAELDGTHPFNIFSVGNDKVTIGEVPNKVKEIDNSTPIGSYVTGRYALSIDGPLLFNPHSAADGQLIGSSHVMAPYSLFYPEVVRGATVIQGGNVTAAVGNTAVGGSIVLLPGSGTTAGLPGETFGYVSLSPEAGNVYIGKRYAQGPDKFQVYGSSYFSKLERTGPNLVVAVNPADNSEETVTGLSGYIMLGTNLDRNAFDSTFLVSGKIAHSWNTKSLDPLKDVHQTYTAGVYGAIGSTANYNSYAAFFEDYRSNPNLPAVLIRKAGIALQTNGSIYSDSNMYAAEFSPTVNWFNIPFGLLNVVAKLGSQTVSGQPGQEAVIITDPFGMANDTGQITTASIRAYRYGQLVNIAFHFTVKLNGQPSTAQDSFLLSGLPIDFRASTTGVAYASGKLFPNAAGHVGLIEGFIPVITRTTEQAGAIQFILPKAYVVDSLWSNAQTINLSGTITCNGTLNDFAANAADFPPATSSTSSIGT